MAPQWLESAVEELSESAAATKLFVWSPQEAAQLFERKHSTENTPIGPDDVRTLQRLDEAAVKHMAGGDHLTAVKELDAAAQHYLQAPSEFNRQDPALVLDLCLHRSLALLETGTPSPKIAQQVRQCRMRIPLEIEPNLLKHTNPLIRQILNEVSAELRAGRVGTLEVHSRNGCQVRLDGIDAGTISRGKYVGSSLMRGAHRVSVVCADGKARVYPAEISAKTGGVDIDHAFDSTVRSRPFMWLDASAEGRVDDYAATIAGVLGNTTVILLEQRAEGSVALRRIGDGNAVVLGPPAQLGESWPEAQRLAAIFQLLQGPPVSPTNDASAEEPPRHQSARSVTEQRRSLKAGYWLTGVGGAAVATSIVLHLRARSLRGDTPALSDSKSKASRLGTASMITGVAGSLQLLGSFGLLADRFERGKSNLWPAVAMIAAGAALLGTGGWQLHSPRNQDDANELGTLLISAGVSLVTVPIAMGLFVYLPRRIQRRNQQDARIRVSAGLASLQLEGSF